AQTIDHVVEDLGQVAHLAATGCRWQIDREITTGNFAGGFCQAVERSDDETSKTIRGGGDCNEQKHDHEQRNVSKTAYLQISGLGRDLGDDRPVYLRDVLECANDIATSEAGVGKRSARPFAQLLHCR